MASKKKPLVYFAVGQVVGHLTILKIVVEGTTMFDTTYRVKWPCCGYEEELSHRGIIARLSCGAQRCTACAKIRYRLVRGRTPRPATEIPPYSRSVVVVKHGRMRGGWPSLNYNEKIK